MKKIISLISAIVCVATVSYALPRDSLGMRLLGQTLLGPARQVVVQGNYAYVGVSCGLLILDVTDPANPVEMGRAYDVNFSIIEDIFVQNGYAYLVDAYNGLAVVDVRDVRNPRVVGRAWNNGHMFGVWVKDTLAYMVGSNSIQDSSDFIIINVKNPTAPFAIAGYDTCFGERVQVVDTLAFVPDGLSLDVYSVFDPLSMRRVAQYFNTGSSRKDVCVRDTFCYVVSQDSGLVILNIRDPLNPQKLGRYKPNGGPMRISVLGNYAYLCEDLNLYSDYPMRNLSRFWAIDITDPANPFQVGWYESPGSGGDVFAKDSLLYFADGCKGLRMIDVRDPSQPREITHYSTGDVCWELVRQGDYLYVAHGGDGLRVLDVTNPAQPVEIGHLEMPWRTFDIMLMDSLLYAAEGDSGLVVVDIRNPAQPVMIGRWNLLPNQMTYSLFVQDSLAYLCGSSLWIVNVADPRNPYYVGGMGGSGARIYDLWVRGRYAYVPDGLPWTFNVIDVGDPRDPRVVFTWDSLAPGGREVEGVDTLLFTLADFRAPGDGFYVLTIADPVRPHGLGSYARPVGEDDFYGLHYFPPHYVWVGGRTYYYQTVEYCGRMDLVDVQNPRPARSIRHYESGWTIADVWGENLQVAYGGAYLGNLLVFQVDSIISGVNRESDVPLRARGPELAVSPNPVRGSCIIRYWSGKEENVRLTIFDVTGRAVRSFSSHISPLTSHEFSWDGRDGSGKEVRSGVFFLRSEGGGQTITKKIVVMK